MKEIDKGIKDRARTLKWKGIESLMELHIRKNVKIYLVSYSYLLEIV